MPYLQEAFHLLEEGATAEEIDAAVSEFGLPMGPVVLIDLIGLDILMYLSPLPGLTINTNTKPTAYAVG